MTDYNQERIEHVLSITRLAQPGQPGTSHATYAAAEALLRSWWADIPAEGRVARMETLNAWACIVATRALADIFGVWDTLQGLPRPTDEECRTDPWTRFAVVADAVMFIHAPLPKGLQ
jgi:hypothetical protein